MRVPQLWVIAALCALVAANASARNEYLEWWSEEYPSSSSDDSICQLCHERAGGGNGWNRYGWSIRSVYFVNLASSGNPETALKQSLQDISSISDGGSSTFIAEINANTQPGWRNGNVNIIRFVDESSSTISPPATLPCALQLDASSDERTCSTANPISSDIVTGTITVEYETVAQGFTAPVAAISAPGEPQSMYVIEQAGLVKKVNLDSGDQREFVDFSAQVVANLGNLFGGAFAGYDERGLLGFVFHPDYQSNGKVYTYISKDYIEGEAHFSTLGMGETPDHMSVVSEWIVINPNDLSSTATSERVLLVIDQPQFNHNGGMLEFDSNGHLLIAVGDGGAANDAGAGHGTDGNGRDNTNPLGSILRIDVDAIAPTNGRYGIPSENPFVAAAGVDEILFYGLRNPYRFTVDGISNQIFIGDVGQDAIEEVNRIGLDQTGANFGWNYKEGSFFFSVIDGTTYVSESPPAGEILPTLVDPIVEYDHGEGLSVIGGYVYRGSDIPALNGRYVFGDWGRSFAQPDGRVFYIDQSDQLREFQADSPPNIHVTGFGRDSQGELYIVGSQGFRVTDDSGFLKKIVPVQQDDEVCLPILATNGNVSLICF